MEKEPLFVALSNQKGGVGKSTLTILLASYFHYRKEKNVLVVDCDYPQHSIRDIREWDVKAVEKSETLQNRLMARIRGKQAESLQHPDFHPGRSQTDGVRFSGPFRYGLRPRPGRPSRNRQCHGRIPFHRQYGPPFRSGHAEPHGHAKQHEFRARHPRASQP